VECPGLGDPIVNWQLVAQAISKIDIQQGEH